MAYKMLVLDIDGTLTNTRKEITPKTLEAIKHLQKRDEIVVLASGRPTAGILPIAEKLELSKHGGYILSFNGAKVFDCKTGEAIYQKVLPRDIIPSIYEEAVKYNVGIITYKDNSIISGIGMDEFIQKEAKINHIEVEITDSFVDYITFDVNKCLMTGEPTHLAKVELEMQAKYGHMLSIYRSEPYFLEIMPLNIDKAYSLGKLLNYLGLSKDEMICMGDGFNDRSMIQFAGLGVAMSNAQDVVKEDADYITYSNDRDGVAHVIEKFIINCA
ncbi:hypothetical protein EDD66_104139 [Mobilisporobacter senegalensis]|uniref:Cof subfamily protein (Haloacid dehalogenase superfamily)/HAD superfamily hydrolase (TIGR01484 family) n=1 Tax=Mobilisporobacter senegalensis TaxID=1329262 RepID=A0A3N1XPF3_9FIRM|nr:Cof-type HAD-IIB family hydrolase [Mobilisporobacter senegalensis]ROR28553.1 hypothetical protein EDD66_104139 [Mobilisporobacter senegalensis]